MLFGHQLGLALLRIAWVGAFITFIPAIALRVYLVAIFSGAQLFYSVFVLLVDQLRPFPFFGLLELLSCFVLPAFYIPMLSEGYIYPGTSGDRSDVLAFSAMCILLFSSLPYSLFRIVSTVRSRGKNLFVLDSVTGARRRKPASCTERLHAAGEALFGTELWRKRLPGEAIWVIFGRGVLVACIAAVILFYAYYIIILETTRQVWLTPTIEIRTTNLPFDVVLDEDPAWNVVLDSSSEGMPATEVRALENSTNGRLCSPALSSKVLNFYCPLMPQEIGCSDYPRLPARCISELKFPDLLVTINFTKLHIPAHTRKSMQIMVGLTNDTSKIKLRSSPTTLIPGVNLVGIVNVVIGQVNPRSALTIIGFEIYETFLIPELLHVWPDPLASTEPALISRAPDIATIRLIPQLPTKISGWKIVQDHRDKSLLKGVSSTGGLWTALGGILAFLFGGSILRTMFGVKPLSTSGLAHMFQGDSVRNACVDNYPSIRQEANDTSPNRGVTSLLCDHFINLEYFVDDIEVVDPDVPLLLTSPTHDSRIDTSTGALIPMSMDQAISSSSESRDQV